jgi:hypothetical protein
MHPLASFAVKAVSGGVAAAVLSAGAVTAANPSPHPSPSSSTAATTAQHSDRRVIMRAVIEAEADVLNMKPQALLRALKHGEEVSELARARGLSKSQFTSRLLVNLTLRLDQLVDRKVITKEEARKVLAHIADGHIPFWNGIHRRK